LKDLDVATGRFAVHRDVPDRVPELMWFKSSYSDSSNPSDCSR